jgi:hypothetical protein
MFMSTVHDLAPGMPVLKRPRKLPQTSDPPLAEDTRFFVAKRRR